MVPLNGNNSENNQRRLKIFHSSDKHIERARAASKNQRDEVMLRTVFTHPLLLFSHFRRQEIGSQFSDLLKL